ncbi:MAG TPA: DUF1990 domain-containing protein [Saprospiraceae bacterium]|nr:DUF1990 domain-containing protein [Saprospiraceae bacterium]HMQ83556.1 DUF1990 domain-containing protein [Saprospiraceae bacterium]
MRVSLAFPTHSFLVSYLQNRSQAKFSYPEIGATKGDFPKGYNHDRYQFLIGSQPSDFHKAKNALVNWAQFKNGWVEIFPQQPGIQVGREVLVFFKLFGLWWKNSCRIVYLVDQPDLFGFAYGTLSDHVEKGEEFFGVTIDKDHQVYFVLKAFSKPNYWLAKICLPLTRKFQRRFARDAGNSMRKWLEEHR